MITIDAADLLPAIQALTPEQRREMDAILMAGDAPKWVPQPGPQQQAFESQADILFYGGAAGGGKTDLLLGLGGEIDLTRRMLDLGVSLRIPDGPEVRLRLTGPAAAPKRVPELTPWLLWRAERGL